VGTKKAFLSIFSGKLENIPKKYKKLKIVQHGDHSGAHLDACGLSQLAHGVVLAHGDFLLAALLQQRGGQGRVCIIGKEHLPGKAGPDRAAGLLYARYLFLPYQFLQQGNSSCFWVSKKFVKCFHAILHYSILPSVSQAFFCQTGLLGSYTVTFPDLPGCITEGKSLENALYMAVDALTQWLEYSVETGDFIPAASGLRAVQTEGDEFVNLIRAAVRDDRAVRRTVSIPKWLDEQVSAAGISLSKVLQDALKDRLGVQ